MKKICTEKYFCYIFNGISIVMFTVLFCFAFFQTGENSLNLSDEHIYFKKDSLLWNTVKILISTALLFGLGKGFGKLLEKRAVRTVVLVTVCALSTAFGVYWLHACPAIPIADQYMLCDIAASFNKNDFHDFFQGEYLATYPQNIGMVTLLRGIFAFFGEYNYSCFRCLLVILLPLMSVSGDNIVRILSEDNRKVEGFYLLFSLFCIPVYPYLNFIYGDLIATIISIFAVWMFLSCMRRFSWVSLLLFALAMGAAVALKKNFLILAIAFVIVMLIKLFAKRTWRNLIITTALIAGIVLSNVAIWQIYRDVRPDRSWAMPGLLWVVMGLNDDGANPGWYNDYSAKVFKSSDNDAALANQIAQKDLQEKVEVFLQDPAYMVNLFARKVNSQWNAPMYQCIVMNGNVDRDALLFPADDLYTGTRVGNRITQFMEVYQMLMYGSILFWLLLCRKKTVQIEKYVLLIAVFGGFLFSMIWEAKARYILPYLIMQVPYMALGVNEIILFLKEKFSRFFSKKLTGYPRHLDKETDDSD